MCVVVDVRVRHDSDPELVKRVLIAVVQANPIVLRVPAVALGDPGIGVRSSGSQQFCYTEPRLLSNCSCCT